MALHIMRKKHIV